MSVGDKHKPAAPGQGAQPDRRRALVGRRWNDKVQHFDRRRQSAGLTLGPFKLDDRRKTVYVKGAEKHLSPKLFDLMKIFMNNPGKVLSAAELAANLGTLENRSDAGDLKQYIYLLRQAIEPDPAKPRWLRNVRGFGYQLIIN